MPTIDSNFIFSFIEINPIVFAGTLEFITIIIEKV